MLLLLQSLAVIVLVAALGPSTALPQESVATADRSATISGIGGLAAGMHGTGPVLGGAVTFDWFAVEGSGTYLNRGSGADAFGAHASLLANVTPSGRRSVPYFNIGGGAYRASFDLDDRRFFGSESLYDGGSPSASAGRRPHPEFTSPLIVSSARGATRSRLIDEGIRLGH
ncbi:MAG TPA: hypothetical protein VIK50_06605 [Gemmatimonadaceae bacterium]